MDETSQFVMSIFFRNNLQDKETENTMTAFLKWQFMMTKIYLNQGISLGREHMLLYILLLEM